MWDVFEEMERMRKEMNRLMREFWNRSLSLREPLTDMIDAGDEIVIRVEVPGVSKKDINIELTEDSIRISAKKSRKKEVVEKGYYSKEISAQNFVTSRVLPVKVLPETAKAKYEDGVLEIRVKKAEASKKKKKVKVKVN